MRLFEELIMREDGGNVGRDLVWWVAGAIGLRVEGVGAMLEHLLGIVVGVCRGLDAQVAEHGV